MHTAPSSQPPPGGPTSHYVRWKLDPNATNNKIEPVVLVEVDGEMPKVDSRYETKPYKYVLYSLHDPEAIEGAVGGMYNAIATCNVDDGTFEYWSAGASIAIHEVAFISRHEGG